METEAIDPDPYAIGSILLNAKGFVFSADTFFLVLIIVALLFLSAMISGSEVAFFSLKEKTLQKIRDSKKRKDILVFHLLSEPKILLATILIANNVVNISIIILSVLITTPFFEGLNNALWLFLGEVVVISFFIVVFGEIVPKLYANQHPLNFSRFISVPLNIISFLLKPFSRIIANSSGIFENRLKRKNADMTIEDIRHAIEITSDDKKNKEDKVILQRIVSFGNVHVKQIMTSRLDVIAFEFETPYKKIIELIREQGYSRIPVYKGSPDNIVGLLYIKDLLPFYQEEIDYKWQKLIRKPYFVPDNKKIDDLLREFQSKKVHMAVVVDEYGGFSGIVTLEDILEEIVGEISDEFDHDGELPYRSLDERTYIFNARTQLTDLIKILELRENSFDEIKGEADTIAGLVIEKLGRIPDKGEKIDIPNLEIFITNADRKKVNEVKIRLK